MTEKEAIERLKLCFNNECNICGRYEKEECMLERNRCEKTVLKSLEQRIINQKIFAKEYEKISKQLHCEVKDNLEKSIALEQKDKEIQELKKYDIRNIGLKEDKIIRSPSFTREELDFINIGIGLKSRETRELKEKYNKDTYILQNQLNLANSDRVEKDKMIDLFKCRIVVTENEYKEILKIQEKFLEKDFQDCLIIYFQKKVREENE